MFETVFHLLIILIVLGALFWAIGFLPIPAPFTPVRWVLYLLVVLIAFMVLLPYLGVRV